MEATQLLDIILCSVDVCFYRILNQCSANYGLDHIRMTHKLGEDAVRSFWISSFNVKTLSHSGNLWTCKNTRYPCFFLYVTRLFYHCCHNLFLPLKCPKFSLSLSGLPGNS